MTPTPIFIAALILLPAVGLVVWAWFTMDRIEEDLRSLGGFEGMHFAIGPSSAGNAEGAR